MFGLSQADLFYNHHFKNYVLEVIGEFETLVALGCEAAGWFVAKVGLILGHWC